MTPASEGFSHLTVTKQFSMQGEGHRLSARVAGKDLVVEIASEYRSNLALQVEQARKNKPNDTKLYEKLTDILQELKQLKHDWDAGSYSKMYEKYGSVENIHIAILGRLDKIALKLDKIGKENDIRSLQDLSSIDIRYRRRTEARVSGRKDSQDFLSLLVPERDKELERATVE